MGRYQHPVVPQRVVPNVLVLCGQGEQWQTPPQWGYTHPIRQAPSRGKQDGLPYTRHLMPSLSFIPPSASPLPQLHPFLPAREPRGSGQGRSPQLLLPGVVLGPAEGLRGRTEEGNPIRTAGAETVARLRRPCQRWLHASPLPETRRARPPQAPAPPRRAGAAARAVRGVAAAGAVPARLPLPVPGAAERGMGAVWGRRALRAGLALGALALVLQGLRGWLAAKRYEFSPAEIAQLARHHAGTRRPWGRGGAAGSGAEEGWRWGWGQARGWGWREEPGTRRGAAAWPGGGRRSGDEGPRRIRYRGARDHGRNGAGVRERQGAGPGQRDWEREWIVPGNSNRERGESGMEDGTEAKGTRVAASSSLIRAEAPGGSGSELLGTEEDCPHRAQGVWSGHVTGTGALSHCLRLPYCPAPGMGYRTGALGAAYPPSPSRLAVELGQRELRAGERRYLP